MDKGSICCLQAFVESRAVASVLTPVSSCSEVYFSSGQTWRQAETYKDWTNRRFFPLTCKGFFEVFDRHEGEVDTQDSTVKHVTSGVLACDPVDPVRSGHVPKQKVDQRLVLLICSNICLGEILNDESWSEWEGMSSRINVSHQPSKSSSGCLLRKYHYVNWHFLTN